VLITSELLITCWFEKSLYICATLFRILKHKLYKNLTKTTKNMKKSVLVIALAFGVSGAFAQDLTSKKGEPILPEAGDWAISMNMDPIFEFVGNAFSGYTGQNAAPGVNWLNGNQTIVGKKFIDEKSAYRVLVRIGFSSQATKAMIADATVTTAPVYPATPSMVEDKMSVGNTNIGIGAGKEFRRGKTRLQGYYGADAMIWLSSTSTKYTYGNALSVGTPAVGVSAATTTNFGSNLTTDPYGNAARITSLKSGMTFGIGVRAFIGAEYFIFPKIAVGAEYGWGIGYQMAAKGKQSDESIGGATAAVGTVNTTTSGSSKFGVDTDLNQGTIFGFKGSNTGTASLKVTMHF
jgi:hypothetical protein